MKIPEQWTFKSEEVAKGFDNHVREQLPWYDMATRIIAHVARHYIPEGGTVYDIGASTGNVGNAIRETLESRKASLTAIDNSADMMAIYQGPGEAVIADAMKYEFQDYDFAIAFLVVMFLPVAERKDWLHQMTGKIKRGGALLVFDKCEQAKGYAGTVVSRLAMAEKLRNGVPAEQVLKKELSLAGVQRPIDIIETIPPNAIEVFRFGDFAGWIIESSKL
jgi:tRNA (cmo5U34)-methyltransferase